MPKTCKQCANYTPSGRWCNEWAKALHPNSVACGRFVPAVAEAGDVEEETPFVPTLRVTITSDEESAMYGGGKVAARERETSEEGDEMSRPRTIPEERVQEAVRLRDVDGLSQEQIAERMGLERSTVQYMLKRAKRDGARTDAESSTPVWSAPSPEMKEGLDAAREFNDARSAAVESLKPSAAPGPKIPPVNDERSSVGCDVAGEYGPPPWAHLEEELRAVKSELRTLRGLIARHQHLPSGQAVMPQSLERVGLEAPFGAR